MSNWRNIPSLASVYHQLRAGCWSEHPCHPGARDRNGQLEQRTLEGWDCYDTRCSGCITATAGCRARGRFPLHLQFYVSPFPHTGHCWCATLTARAIHAAISSQKSQKEQTGIKTEILTMLLSIHIAENNSAPSGVSRQSQLYLYLFSHWRQDKDSYPKRTRKWSLWHGCFLLAFWMTSKPSD